MNILETIAHAEPGQIEEYARAQARAAYVGDYRLLCRLFGKYLMVVDGRDNSVAPHLVMDGFWEMPTTRAICRFVKPEMVCFDVGANFGYFTVLLGHLVGAEGAIEAFEPNDRIRECLRRSISLNGLGAVVNLWPSAIGEQAVPRFAHGVKEPPGGEFAWLRVPPEQWGSAEVVYGNLGQGGQAVDVMRLDDTKIAPYPPDFVKVDAEGHEPAVWASMAGLLAREGAEPVVCMEWAPWRYDDAGAFLDQISADRYGIQRVADDGKLADVGRDALVGADEGSGLEMLWLTRGKS